MRGLGRMAGLDVMTDVERIEQEIEDLNSNNPDLAGTPQGLAYQSYLRRKIIDTLDAKEPEIGESMKMLGKAIVESPTEMLDEFGAEMIEDPLLPLSMAVAYNIGTPIGGAIMTGTKLVNVANKLAKGGHVARRAAVLLKNSAEAVGVMGMEATQGYLYEVVRNQAIGRDPFHNAETMAAISASLGVGMKGLSTLHQVLTGFPGRYASTLDLMKDVAARNDLPLNPVVKAFKEKVYAGVPLRDMTPEHIRQIVTAAQKEVKHASRPDIAKGKWATTFDDLKDRMIMRFKREHIDYDQLKPELRDKFDSWLYRHPNKDKFFEEGYKYTELHKMYVDDLIKQGKLKPKSSYFIGTHKKPDLVFSSEGRKIFYNAERIDTDWMNELKWFQGLSQKGHKIKSADAAIRREAAKDLDLIAMRKYFADYGGATKYGEFLLNKEFNKLKIQENGPRFTPVELERAAMAKAFEDMGKKIGDFKKGNFVDRNAKKLYNVGKKVSARVIQDPHQLINPFIDMINSPIQFTKDIKRGITDPVRVARDHQLVDVILRDLEGQDQTLALLSREFKMWGEQHLNADEREYLTYYLQGIGDKYNKQRRSQGLPEIKATEKIKESAKVYRNAMNKALRAYNQAVDNPSERMRYLPNYVPIITKKPLGISEDEMVRMIFKDIQSGLQTKSPHAKARRYTNTMEAEAAGVPLLTKDIAKLTDIYMRSLQRSALDRQFLKTLKNSKTETGHKFITSRQDAPPGYVEFKHSAFKDDNGHYYWVNPNMAPDLRLYFDTSSPGIARRAISNIVQISKRLTIGWSGFHIAALGWSALVSGVPINEVFKAVLPFDRKFKGLTPEGLMALTGDNEAIAYGLRNGLRIGIVEELRGDALINALNGMANWVDRVALPHNKFVRGLGKTFSSPTRGVAKFQKAIDDHLWDHVATPLKAQTFLVHFEKLRHADALRAQDTGAPLTDLNVLAQRAAQFANDAYGNQNWQQMAMNVQNNMGRRIAQALNRSTSREMIRWLVFAPDWSLSNLRVLGKVLDVSDPGHQAYLAYAIRSAVLFAMIGEGLQQMNGQGSLFDRDPGDDTREWIKKALRPDLGGGKQVELSKQLSEVLRIGIHGPWHVMRHKLGTLPKSIIEADTYGEILQNFGGYSVPIGVQQTYKDPSLGLWGVAGAPIYDGGK